MKNLVPLLINGDIAIDDRGKISFVNTFDFENVKRFYQIRNFSKKTIRAFHGHLQESKYIYVVSGAIIAAAVYLDDVKNPSKDNKAYRYILSDNKPSILFIPPRYANGFRILEENTNIIIFSTSTLEESKQDDYRFPVDYWGNEIWISTNR